MYLLFFLSAAPPLQAFPQKMFPENLSFRQNYYKKLSRAKNPQSTLAALNPLHTKHVCPSCWQCRSVITGTIY